MLRVLCGVAFGLVVAVLVPAQVVDTGTGGCSNAGVIATPVVGSPSVGNTITVANTQLPCNNPGTFSFVLFNFDGAFIPGINWSCFATGNPCALLDPVIGFGAVGFTFSVPIVIPMNAGLVGSTVYAQGGCIQDFFPPPCFNALNRIVSITVTP